MTTDLTRLGDIERANKFAGIESALKAAGVSSLYQKFVDAGFDDAYVSRCLNDDEEINTISALFTSKNSFLKFQVFYRDQNDTFQASRPQGRAGHLSRSNTFQQRGHRLELKPADEKDKAEFNPKKVDIAPPPPLRRHVSVGPCQKNICISKMSGQEDDTGRENENNSSTSKQEEPAPAAALKSAGMEDTPKVILMEAKEATLSNISGQEDDGEKDSNYTIISVEGPVQIVELVCVEEDEEERTELLLQDVELRKIVSRVRDGRHIAVLTIAGPSHPGKSFLLSYIVTYLNSIQASQGASPASLPSEWIEKCRSRMTGPLKEEFLWRSGCGVEKTGIRMWSKPFPLKSRDGSEYDLLLVDTQRVIDSFTSEKDFAMLIGLSLLTSSSLIFQTLNRLHENSLKTLTKAIHFGLMNIGLNEPTKEKEAPPFENLTFLINDWNFPEKYPFGAKGGSELLSTNLSQKNTKNGTELRNQIKKSFEGLNCYLMPFPGSEGTDVNYNSPVTEMSPEFVTHLKQFIENLLLQDTIQIKTVGGNPATSEGIFEYFKNLVKAFNTDELPTNTTMTHVLTQVYNLNVLNNCKAVYEAEIKRLFVEKQKIFFFENEFHQIHEEAISSAFTQFDSTNKMGSDSAIQELRNELIKTITEDVHEHYRLRNNEARRQGVQDALHNLSKTFATELKEAIAEACEGNDSFCSDGTFQNVFESCRRCALNNLGRNLMIGSTNFLSENEKQNIDAIFLNAQTAARSDNQKNKDAMEKSLRDTVTVLTKSFSIEFKIATVNKCMTLKDLENLFSATQEITVKTRLSTEFGRSSLLIEGQRYLRTAIEGIRKDLITQAELETLKLITEGRNVVAELGTAYEKNMETNYPKEIHEPATLLTLIITIHKSEVQDAFRNFAESPAIQTLPETQRSELKIELSKIFISKFKFYAQNSLVKIEERLVNNHNKALKNYDGTLLTSDSLYAAQQTTVEAEFQKCISDIREIINDQPNNNILATSKKRLSQLLSINAMSHKASITFSEKLQCLSDDCENVQNLIMIAQWAQAEIIALFEQSTRDGYELIDVHLLRKELKSDLARILDEEKEFIQLKLLKKDAELKTFFPTVIKLYKSEMKKIMESNNALVSLEELKLHHQNVSARAIQTMKDSKLCEVTPYLEQKIKEHLEVPYTFYMDGIKMKNSTAAPAIGIDLGTTYSCVSIFRWHKGRPEFEVIKNKQGETTTPSHVYFPKSGNPVAGSLAKDKISTTEEPKVYDAKRLIGRRFADKEVQEDMKHWPFTVVKDSEDGTPNIRIQNSNVRPENVSSHVLRYLKESAETYLKRKIENAVITVPAYFNDAQRTATKEAGKIAGLNVLKIINEPTAAALAYDLDNHDEVEKNILIFDLGGGTFDVSVLHIKKGDVKVKAVTGDTHLGGQDFDKELVQHCIDQFKLEHSIDLLSDSSTRNLIRHRLENECEKKKRHLSEDVESVDIKVERITPNLDLNITITKRTFEDLCEARFKTCIDLVAKALEEAELKTSEIDDVVLVGGSSRIPKVQEMLKKFFNGKILSVTKSSDEVVARGAARLAFSLNGPQNQNGESSLVFSDVVPLSLGIEVREANATIGFMSIIIQKNTTVPYKIIKEYSSPGDAVAINIYEGENTQVLDNNLLGNFYLYGITYGEALHVTMEINDENILKVTAVSVNDSGINNSLEIKFTR